MRRPIIAVDFDGTITIEHSFPQTSPPNIELIEWLRKMHDKGVYIVLWTCREGLFLDIAKEYCKEHNIPIDYWNENVPYVEPDTRKIFADFYIDDKGFTPLKAYLDMIDNYLEMNALHDWIPLEDCEEILDND